MNCLTVDSTLVTVDSTLLTADNVCASPLVYYNIKVGAIKILISNCVAGIYLRWWFNGWHYFNFTNGYEIALKTESKDTQVTRMFSRISKIERPTRITADYSYQVTLEGISSRNIPGFTGLLLAERVEQYEGGIWREVDLTRGDHLIKDAGTNGYILNFEVTRKELPITSSVYHKSQRLYIGDVLCDMDDDEIVPINKQVNDIAEMQDRQSDFTAQFKIRKTRVMQAKFELSGEPGINTNYPYRNEYAKLIQDNLEVITNGIVILDNVDEQYYYVSILSGNKNLFTLIDKFKLRDLSLPTADHTWNQATQVISQSGVEDFIYPLCEPSDDGGITPLTDDGDRVELYGGWIWPFIKVKAIWDEIFLNAGFHCEGDILTDLIFTKLWMPIVNRDVNDVYPWLYSLYNSSYSHHIGVKNQLMGGQLIKGNLMFSQFGVYITPFNATYTVKITLICDNLITPPQVWFRDVVTDTELTLKSTRLIWDMPKDKREYIYEGGNTALTGDWITIMISNCVTYDYGISFIEISNAKISYGSSVTPHVNLPDMTQTEFIKMICNMFGLIPEVTPRDRKINFWNFRELYLNIPLARDWSAYLSERDDNCEFKFGDYAQNNYFKYKTSDDVLTIDQGKGDFEVDDETLPSEKDVVELPVSTCDMVDILTNIFKVSTSRIAFNKFNAGVYDIQDSIDPRIVYIDRTKSIASPPYEKTLGIRPAVGAGGAMDIDSPFYASSLETSFSYLLASNYSGLSRLLTKTNLRKAKFNLPVYEVAGLKHYIPIYLSQYKAYFYVNKINNYVPGQLCEIDLIKL